MLAPRFKGRYLLLNASHGLASHSTSAPHRLLVSVAGDQRNRALQGLFANCVTSGGRQPPRATNHLRRRFSKVEQISKLALSHIPAGQTASTYPLPGESCSLRVPPRPGEISSEPRRGLHRRRPRSPGREDCGAPEGAKFREGSKGAQRPPESSRHWQFLSALLQLSRSLSHSLSPPSLSSLSLPSAPTQCGE